MGCGHREPATLRLTLGHGSFLQLSFLRFLVLFLLAKKEKEKDELNRTHNGLEVLPECKAVTVAGDQCVVQLCLLAVLQHPSLLNYDYTHGD